MKWISVAALLGTVATAAIAQNNINPGGGVSGFSAAPVSGFNSGPVSGFSAQPVTGFSAAPQANPAPATPSGFTQDIVPSFAPNPVTGYSDAPVQGFNANPAPPLTEAEVATEPIVQGFDAQPVTGLQSDLPSAPPASVPSTNAQPSRPPSPF
jgi:hypothetical protein